MGMEVHRSTDETELSSTQWHKDFDFSFIQCLSFNYSMILEEFLIMYFSAVKEEVLFVGMLGFSDINHVGPLRKCRSWTYQRDSTLPGLVCRLRLSWKGQSAERSSEITYTKGWQTIACRPNLAYHLFLQIKFCWNTAMLIYVHTAFMLQEQSWVVLTKTIWSPKPKIFHYLVFYRKSLLTTSSPEAFKLFWSWTPLS